MISVGPVILVEGKYDKIKLSQIFDATILTTDGFGIFRQKDKLQLLRRLAETRGLLVFTDSDGAGFVIRSYLKGALPKGKIYHAYLPDLYGKERRKTHASKEGKLGVEGVSAEIILQAVARSGALEERSKPINDITKADLYSLGLSGGKGSKQRRQGLLERLALPQQLSPNALLEVLNCVTDLSRLKVVVAELDGETRDVGKETVS